MFKILVSKQAKKFIKRLDRKRQKKIINVLDTLQTNPLPFRIYDMKKLRGTDNLYRIRIGNIRITYELFLAEFLIKVRHICFRGKTYKRK